MPAATFAFGAVRLRRWTVLLALTLLAAGIVHASGSSDAVKADPTTCSTPRPLPAGTSTRIVQHDGESRSYLMYVPPGYDGSRRTPVVFLFHGLGGTPEKVMSTSAMAALADREGFIVVAPQARGQVSEWDFRSPGTVVNSDISFVRQLVDTVRTQGCVDPAGLFAAGFSNGSALVLALACDPQSQFAAYGAVSGPYMAPDCSRAKPASIAYFHGLRDDVVPYTGASTAIGPLPPVDDTVAQWVSHDKCPANGATTSVAGGLRHFSWKGCADGSAVSVFVLEDSGHSWPDRAPDASGLMWSFFQRAKS